jgi:hypothetical protein
MRTIALLAGKLTHLDCEVMKEIDELGYRCLLITTQQVSPFPLA